MEQTEEKTWKRFLNKQVSLTKNIGDKCFFYKGIIIVVFEDKLILDDRKLGRIPLSFDGLSLINVGGVEQ